MHQSSEELYGLAVSMLLSCYEIWSNLIERGIAFQPYWPHTTVGLGWQGHLSAASPYISTKTVMYGLATDIVESCLGSVLVRCLSGAWSAGTLSAAIPYITVAVVMYG